MQLAQHAACVISYHVTGSCKGPIFWSVCLSLSDSSYTLLHADPHELPRLILSVQATFNLNPGIWSTDIWVYSHNLCIFLTQGTPIAIDIKFHVRLNWKRHKHELNHSSITVHLSCAQAHFWVTRACDEEQSDPAERTQRGQESEFSCLAASPRNFARVCAPTWAFSQAIHDSKLFTQLSGRWVYFLYYIQKK